ncbi:glycosyltransferase family 2 protein [Nitrospira sp. NS4]|uniref:glycosyltransferase family 2 protein n=1 Tax=Nitrospira sp. NS4 TaxID=3414498 RepID=UPI003C2C255E
MSQSGRQSGPVDVSVIIPTYNRGSFIVEAVESVLAQTYQSFEVIVVDDGSTDDTLERLGPYQSNIAILKTNHGGAPHARNAGMKVARGKYVAFLDSDDRYLPHKLALQVQILEKFPDVGMVYSEFSGFGDGVEEEFHLKTYHSAAFRNGETYGHYFEQVVSLREAGLDCSPWSDRKIYIGQIFDRYLKVLFVFTNSLMVRRSVLDMVGGQDESFPLFEEYEFVLRIAKRYPIAFVDLPTYHLRYHAGQISTTHGDGGAAVFVEKQRQLLRVVERHGVQDHHYYLRHKAAIDATMGKLHRALGVALMCHPGHDAEARQQFLASARYGLPVQGFWLLTFVPGIFRRVVMKLHRLVQRMCAGV